MIVADRINSQLQKLPSVYHEEVLHFIEFLSQKVENIDLDAVRDEWNDFSLTQALNGLEDDLYEYNEADLKERWR